MEHRGSTVEMDNRSVKMPSLANLILDLAKFGFASALYDSEHQHRKGKFGGNGSLI